MDGWIRSYRKMFNNPVVCKDAEHYAVWGYLLHNATHTPKDILFEGRKITLKPGELVTSIRSIADKFSISKSKVERILKTFEIEKQIETQAKCHGRLIYLVNWNKYQKIETQNGTEVGHKWDTSGTQVGHKISGSLENTGVEDPLRMKELKNERIKEIYIESSSLHSDDMSDSPSDSDTIIALWNELDGLGNIKAIKRMDKNSKRYKNLQARLKTYTLDDFKEAIENIRQSKFLQGGNKKGWTITFEWFVLPNNFPKVLEGRYNDTKKDDLEDW